MRRSKTEIYVHLVWATAHRKRVLTPEIERIVYRAIQQEAQNLGCAVLALNGTTDHVHLVVQIPGKVATSRLAQAVKGISSRLLNEMELEEAFDWQDHYAAFSLSRSHLQRVITYVNRQKEHHAQNTTWPEWEETDEDIGP